VASDESFGVSEHRIDELVTQGLMVALR